MKNEVVENYQQDEQMMILIFAQWCINHDLNPIDIYERAYPGQTENEALKKAIEATIPKQSSDYIATETLLTVLSLFGNEELAFIVSKLENNR